jgi:hypothetical protein
MIMRQLGSRREPEISTRASGVLLADGALFSEAVWQLARVAFIPKGVYRFKSHEAANRHDQDCLADAMASLAARRADG